MRRSGASSKAGADARAGEGGEGSGDGGGPWRGSGDDEMSGQRQMSAFPFYTVQDTKSRRSPIGARSCKAGRKCY